MPTSADETLPPVPDDLPPPGTTQLPWNQIPKFIPGVTNVQEYVQKLKFLGAMWPVEFLDQLAPRAALLVEGTAFRKVARIAPAKLKVKSMDGIAALVEAIGGSWGSTELEERYEFFEKALYGTIQRGDESHDSYLSRMESSFVELIARNTSLEEVQAYVLLRQSTLNSEDKKRILLEHGGDLKYSPVVRSFRLLGSRFFTEFQTGKSSQKTKVYDVNMTETAESSEGGVHSDFHQSERAYVSHSEDVEPDLDQDFIDALVSQEDADALTEDADALTVANFEGEFEEFLQETPEMYEALTSYIEARSKLVEKKKSRGFWPIKGKSKHGKGRGKSFGKRSRDRDALLQRIARSHCRKCGALGHWKAECPMAQGSEKSHGPAASATAHVVIEDRPFEVFHVSSDVEEVFSEAEDEYEMPSHDTSVMPTSADESLPPVPDDIPPPGTTQLPWNQIPKFIPGVTNVQEYVQKLKFLGAMWPVEFLDQLAPRAALLVEGTAFRKVARIAPGKLKVKSMDGIAALVEAIGGSWGSTELEERYEFFEKALYGTIQRGDESHDSYLSRMEASFVELIARNTSLEEVQAYVLLRQSTLNSEDKKRILLEHGGDLKYSPVVRSFRLLGSRFFTEFQTGKSSQKTKVYDVNMTETADSSEGGVHSDFHQSERAYVSHSDDVEPDLDQDFIDALVSQEDADALTEDADALTVANFEGEFEEFLQETPEMYEALTSYIEARSKLVEKKKSRGFWPIKGKSKHGKGRGKSFGKRSRDRDALLQRIARSHCRKCGALGHWKAECPLNQSSEKSHGPAASATANVVIEDRPFEVFHVSSDVEEVFSEAEDEYEMPSHDTSLQNSPGLL
eukprot:s1339_g14.t1